MHEHVKEQAAQIDSTAHRAARMQSPAAQAMSEHKLVAGPGLRATYLKRDCV
jgi:hypothetical protein